MNRVSGTDALYIAIDSPQAPAQIGGIALLDTSSAPDFTFDRFRSLMAERLSLAPRFTQRVREIPLGLGRPFWVDDVDFDIDNHLRRVAVPAPGGMRELAELCGDLFSMPLDRRLPLWELWYIEGLEGGKVATFQKNHHCMIDGGSGRGLLDLMYDLEPNPPARAQGPRAPRLPREREHGDAELLLRGIGSVLATPFRFTRWANSAARRGVAALPYLLGRDAQDAPPMAVGVPRVSFNDRVGPRRGWAYSSVSLERIRMLRRQLDVKVNDIVLALSAAATRRYLQATGELPREPLKVTIPVSTRAADDVSAGNQVATMIVPWPTHLADPVERVRRIQADTKRSKEMTQALRATEIRSMGDTAPPAILNLAYRALASLMDSALPLPANAIVSNVPGPPVPLYMAGAKLEAMYPFSMVQHGIGLNVTVMSYLDRMDFGFTVDADLVPDPWYIADGIPLALDELEKAASA
jgi:WS/DGAT/MGAT family acyltransferase